MGSGLTLSSEQEKLCRLSTIRTQKKTNFLIRENLISNKGLNGRPPAEAGACADLINYCGVLPPVPFEEPASGTK